MPDGLQPKYPSDTYILNFKQKSVGCLCVCIFVEITPKNREIQYLLKICFQWIAKKVICFFIAHWFGVGWPYEIICPTWDLPRHSLWKKLQRWFSRNRLLQQIPKQRMGDQPLQLFGISPKTAGERAVWPGTMAWFHYSKETVPEGTWIW